jgi:hypothetical protein
MRTTRPIRAAGFSVLVAAAAVSLGVLPRAAAEDAPGKAPAPAPLEVRWFDVGGLVMGRTAFDSERGPSFLDSSSACLAESPSFASAPDERAHVAGTIDEVIELLKTRAGGPGAWDEEGTYLNASGERWLVLRGTPALQEEVAAAIAALERETGTSVTVDVALLEGDPAAAAGPGGVGAAVARGALRVVGGVRTVGQEAHRTSAFYGRERAFVTDHDVEVAQDARTSDPIVEVQPEGLAVQVFVDDPGADLALDVRAWTAAVADLRAVRTAGGETVDVPTVEVANAATLVRAKEGVWTAVALSGSRTLAVRATRREPPAGRAPAPFPSLAGGGDPGALASASVPVSALGATLPNARGPRIGLEGSTYSPPALAELAEPSPAAELALVAEMVRTLVDPASWEQEGRSLEVRNARLHVRHDARHVEAVRAVTDAARERAVGSLRFRATVVRLPLSSFPEWIAGLDDGATLLSDGGAALLSRPGVRVVDRASVRTTKRGRNATFSGRTHRYVKDYDVEVAEKSAIGDPVLATAFAGLVLDVDAGVVGQGAGVACEVRLDRGTWEGVREVRTAHGAVECPTLGLLRVRAGCTIPMGATRLVGLGVAGDEATLVLLTAGTD